MMDKPQITLIQLVVHFVDKKNHKLDIAPSEQNVSSLDPIVVTFLSDLISDLWVSNDSGTTTSARFSRSNPSAQPVQDRIASIRRDEKNLYDCSVEMARHLFDVSTPNASTGLLAVVRYKQSSNRSVYVAILKIEVKDEKLVKLLSSSLTKLTVEDVQNRLLGDILKGAIYPHPQRSDYDLKVTDKQASSNENTLYFSRDFLGCESKKSDDHQVKVLITELERYAQDANIPFANELVPGFVTALQDLNRDITTTNLSILAQDTKLFGCDFNQDHFIDHIQNNSKIGNIDIPKNILLKRGTGQKDISRVLKIKIIDPKYRGVLIIGPAKLIKDIMVTDGDTVTFTIQTTKDGFRSDIE
jgi:hypothetical protein